MRSDEDSRFHWLTRDGVGELMFVGDPGSPELLASACLDWLPAVPRHSSGTPQSRHLAPMISGRASDFGPKGRFLDPGPVVKRIEDAGFVMVAQLERAPIPGAEYPSRRAYLLAQRRP